MRLYKPHVTSININGVDYHADSQGVIDLPGHLVTAGLFAAGWVDARGHLARLARAEKAAGPAEAKATPPVEAQNTELQNTEAQNTEVQDVSGEAQDMAHPPPAAAAKPTTTSKPKKPGISATPQA